ncbi:glycosyltransferase family A protein [Pedobacter agri]|uniref:glycosyltransferase family 2 protein n=1 Tax=Pedobacter agri TaxID=454586 RepID=UPI0029301F9C|nr:glycosyltransferase family A protein [Pedobacter agri]
MSGLVSIIIPSFNYGHLINETLQSVIKQTYRNWECIIVDDGSTDNTAEVVNQFIKENPQYQFKYHHVKNGGTSAAKNTGIELASGEYVQFLDADDLLSEDKLAVQMHIAEKMEADLVFSKSIFFSGTFPSVQYVEKYPNNFLAEESLNGHQLWQRLIQNNILTISSPIVKRALLVRAGMFNPELQNNEDWLLWFNVAMLSPNFLYDKDERSFVLIRVHQTSAMANHQKMFEGEVVVRQYMDLALNQSDVADQPVDLKALNLNLLALHQIRSLNAFTGLSYILSKFVKNPVKASPLLGKGIFRLGTRLYKSVR